MVRFFDKPQISEIASSDIIPITDVSDSDNDKKITIAQLQNYIMSGTTNFAEKDLSNTNMLTDAILTAPNGVIVANSSNNAIIAKSGAKFLFADGRNADGTFKSISYTLSEDKTQSITTLSNGDYVIFLTNSGTLTYASLNQVYVSRTQPTVSTSTAYWYDILTNYWKTTTNTGSTWSNITLNALGQFSINNSLISKVIPNTVAYIPNSEALMVRDASNITPQGKENIKNYIGYSGLSNIDLSNISNTGKNNIASFALVNTPVKTISGTNITLDDNTVHKLTLSGSTTFYLPSNLDGSKFHQMLVLCYMSTTYSISSLGTTHYFNNEAPDLDGKGTFTLIYEYDGSNWVVGALTKDFIFN